MVIDKVKLARQELSFERWRNGKPLNGILRYAVGIITAVTGFGKTFIAVLSIKHMNKTHPDRTCIVVVPTTKLLEDWTGYRDADKVYHPGHIEIHGLFNVRVFVVNTYVRYKDWECDFLILDEAHRYSNQEASHFSTILSITKYKFLMGLTATLSKKQEEFFAAHGIPVVDVVSLEEAQKYGYVAPSKTFNLGISLSAQDEEFNKEINDKFKFFFSRFNHEFDLVRACSSGGNKLTYVKLKDGKNLGARLPDDWRKEWARVNKYDGDPKHPYSPENIKKNAAQCMMLIAKRKDKWQNFPSKIDVALKLIDKFKVQTICFTQTSAFADKLVARMKDIAVAYHTNLTTVAEGHGETIEIGNAEEKEDLISQGYKILGTAKRKKAAMTRFLDPNDPVRVIVAVKALDEGMDVPNIAFALQLAYDSTTRQDIQRNGRAGRKDYSNLNKTALVVNLYMKGTQEEKWLREKQKGQQVHWVDSIDDISLETVINLSTEADEITISESDIISTTGGDNSASEVRST